MANGIDGIDHLVILVADLDRGRDLYQRLGFRITPRGTHSAHMGTGNYLLVLQRDYVELLGVIAPTANNAEWRAKLAAQGEGLTGMALSTQDHRQAHATLQARGLGPLDPLEFSRPVETAEGVRDAAFSVVRLPAGSLPLNLFVCGHKTRELVWRPEWQNHPNTATRIASVTLPAGDTAAWERAFGVQARDGAIDTGGHAVLQLAAVATPRITFGVANFADATRTLSRNGVPHVLAEDRITVSPAQAAGVEIAFERNPA